MPHRIDPTAKAIDLPEFLQGEAFFSELRQSMIAGRSFVADDITPPVPFGDKSHVYITLYQAGQSPLRWGARRKTFSQTVERLRDKLSTHKRFAEFTVSDASACKIMLEIVTERESVADINSLETNRFDAERFEPGVDGLHFMIGDTPWYYMPTDGFTKSHMSMRQIYTWLAKRAGLVSRNAKQDEAIEAFKQKATNIEKIRSVAYLSDGDGVVPLYRGFPMPLSNSMDDLTSAAGKSADWLIDNMNPKGKFLYYYDAFRDTTADHAHPNPNYYNILRHSGGTVTLLRAYENTRDEKYLDAARHSFDYLLARTKVEEGQPDRQYVFYNKKSKLGGTGIALVALMQYYRLTGDDRYMDVATAMARHLLGRIADDGEFIGYYIHPVYDDGRPLVDVPMEMRRLLFSFYYPGEALFGMALYDLHAPDNDALKAELRAGGRKALDFLVDVRPERYPDLFLSLPADGWLMQAIEAWWGRKEMQDPRYSGFVFSDAKQMIDHMYRDDNAPYDDYSGHFYYTYGDHALPDGARAEGLVAALYLADAMGDSEQRAYLEQSCRTIACGLMQTYNSERSCYAMIAPEKAMNAFRFKLTRHWVRVDSVQHTACFYFRLLRFLENKSGA